MGERSPGDGTAGKLSHVRSTLPLSVTGLGAAMRPAPCRTSRILLPLGLAWLACLPAQAAAATAATTRSQTTVALESAALTTAAEPLRPTVPLPQQSAPEPVLNAGVASVGNPAPTRAQTPPAPRPEATAAPPAPRPVPARTAAGGSPGLETSPAGVIPPGAATTPAPPQPPLISEAEFQELLRTADLDRLNLLCTQLVEAGDDLRLRQLRERLLTIHPAPQPLPVVLANAEVLLSCRMPDGALTVLDRIGPARGAEQVQWLTLQWRAANAALDHRRAALALERLVSGRPDRLEMLLLPLQQRSDGSWASRSALELLASHLESAGQRGEASALLQLSRNQDAAAAERLAQAARLLADLPPELREPLFERALEQAAAVGSWGLVGELLAAQAALPSSPEASARTAERRLRLSRRLDDAYNEWRALQQSADPAAQERRQALRLQLRSPRAAGGHAEALPAPAPLPPLYSAGQARSGRSRPEVTPASAPAADLPGSSAPPPRPDAIPPSGTLAPSQP